MDINKAQKRQKLVPNTARWWLHQKYQKLMGSMIPVTDIIDEFRAEEENLNFELQNNVVLKLLKDLFGDDVRASKLKNSDGNRCIFYLNLSKRSSIPYHSSENSLQQTAEQHGWVLRTTDTNEHEIIHLTKLSNVHVNGSEVCFNLTISSSDITKFSIDGLFGKKIDSSQFGCRTAMDVNPSVGEVLEFLNQFQLCDGISCNEHNAVVVRNPTCDSQCISVDVCGSKRFMSAACQQLVPKSEPVCTSCKHVQKLLQRRKETYAPSKKVKITLLSEQEKLNKIADYQYELKKAKKREEYWRGKFQSECLVVGEEDNQDYMAMFKDVDQSKVSDDMALLFQQQVTALKTQSKQGYRWHPKIIRLCLDIYCTSPKAFDTIKQHLILPSKRLIRYYKNAIPPKSGWDHDVMQWCSKEGKNVGLNEEQRWSGLIFDEMAIQEDLQFSSVNGKTKLIGAVSLGKTYEDTQFLINGKDDIEIASKVMQFCLVTDSGFRFALSHFPVKTMPAISLLEEFWRGVELCQIYGFRIYWLVCDGGEPNRSFIKLLFPHGSDPSQHNFVAYNMHTGKELVVMLDCKHNFKKIRNNLEKSTLKDKSPRQLMLNGNNILFQHWKDAYNWDRNEHSIKVNEHLSDDHFNLTPKSRMRNKLAEDLLDKKMLYLMKEFKIHLLDQGKRAQAEELNETIQLLTFTSELIDLFTRKDKLTSCHDVRIIKAKEFIDYLKTWKGNVKTAKEFISEKLWFDLQAVVIGLEQVVKIKSRAFPDTGIIKPVTINQDVVENIFCQVRGSNGQNNHPTYLSYGSTITSVNIGQDAISKKGNTRGNKECLTRACLPVEHPFKNKNKNN